MARKPMRDLTVEQQLADPDSLLHFVRKLIAYHKATDALWAEGELEILEPGYPFVYVRSSGEKKVLVAINPSDTCRYIPMAEGGKPVFVQNAKVENGMLVMDSVSFYVAEL